MKRYNFFRGVNYSQTIKRRIDGVDNWINCSAMTHLLCVLTIAEEHEQHWEWSRGRISWMIVCAYSLTLFRKQFAIQRVFLQPPTRLLKRIQLNNDLFGIKTLLSTISRITQSLIKVNVSRMLPAFVVLMIDLQAFIGKVDRACESVKYGKRLGG